MSLLKELRLRCLGVASPDVTVSSLSTKVSKTYCKFQYFYSKLFKYCIELFSKDNNMTSCCCRQQHNVRTGIALQGFSNPFRLHDGTV